MKKFYLTTPIYYPNARLHAGHAYTTLICDALARYKRQCGYDVAFLTGTDEHGEKLERAAAAVGKTPQEFVAEKRKEIQALWKLLEIEYTHFIYTDRPDHRVSVQRMLRRAQSAGYVYKGHYQGRYCVYDERYISDGSDPVNCDICGRPAELISEDNYFFKLSAFKDRLLEHYEENPQFVHPNFRFNEVKSFVRGELRDISISRRRIQWGIPWPDDPDQVFYVWYDALTSYMTGVGYGRAEGGDETFRKYWPADIHMIGKDIIRFHAVYWPAFLIAADEPLPRQIVAHGWLKVGEEKMSKSKGNALYVEPVAKLFGEETHGVVSGSDVLRYYVLRDFVFGQDGSVSSERMLDRYNSDLANDLGNLTSRTVTMLNRYFCGVVPETREGQTPGSEYNFLLMAGNKRNAFIAYWNQFEFSRALDEVWSFINTVNSYLNDHQPWAIAEDPAKREQLANVLYTAAEALRFTAVLLHPVMPKATDRIWRQLGCTGDVEDQNPEGLEWGGLKPGSRVGKPEIIFPRLDVAKSAEKLLRLETRAQETTVRKGADVEQPPESKPDVAPAASAASASDRISIEDFAKVEMRVGEVKTAEPVPGATKLLKLMVDIGSEVRQVVAGIAGYYEPEKLVGMKVILVTNLQPRKLRGVESNGMIVAASVGDEGRPVLATFNEDVPVGARLK
jgi:methionyl-tRNA synthetase